LFPEFSIGALSFGPRYLPTYMVTFCIAVLVVVLLGLREARKRGIGQKEALLFLLYSFVFGMFFARAFSVLFFHKDIGILNEVIFFFNVTRSGLSSFGAFFGVFIGTAVFYFTRKANIWRILDIASIGLMLGLAIGRIGCFCAGCCYGIEASKSLPWAVYYKNALRHPTQLYDMANALFVFGVVHKLKTRRLFDGALFLSNLILYSFFRVIIEFFRVGTKIIGINYNQIFYFLLFAASLGLFMYRWKKS